MQGRHGCSPRVFFSLCRKRYELPLNSAAHNTLYHAVVCDQNRRFHSLLLLSSIVVPVKPWINLQLYASYHWLCEGKLEKIAFSSVRIIMTT